MTECDISASTCFFRLSTHSTKYATIPITVQIFNALDGIGHHRMAADHDIAERIQRVLINEAGFDADLVERDYRFAHRKRISLAGFAYRPLDARSACIGVVTSRASSHGVSEYRGLGAPLLLVESDNAFDLWRVGPTTDRDKRIANGLSADGVGRYFCERPMTLRPHRIYEAKTVARVEHAPKQLDLFSEFVDPGLLPFVESKTGERLTQTVVAGIRSLVKKFGPRKWVIKAVFRLLAGKILRDKSVPGFKSATLSHIADVLQKVERHYGSRDALKMSDKKVSSLQLVMADIQQLGDLRNLTTESLGDVYEKALITRDIRKIHGTHKTPGYLVDYVVWQLANWIEEIPVDELRFFEPGCGHAPFLVSLMRLLRTLDLDIPDLSQFFRERFVGIDNDPFALEIARLSLTLADEPNPDGWHGLTEKDMYADGFLEHAASMSTVMLTNPPYESRKAEELLYRTLPNLPAGAVFGVVVPATLLFSNKKRAIDLRKWMIENCQLVEIDLFPDGLFTFGDHECAIIIGRVLKKGTSTKGLQSRLRRVRDNGAARKEFQLDYRFSTTRLVAQSAFTNHEDDALWIAEFEKELWGFIRHNKQLSSIADVNRGLEHKGKNKPKDLKTVEDKLFPGGKLGFTSSKGNWELQACPPMKYLNLLQEAIRRPGTGTDCVPQVLLNYHPVSRETWSLKPFVDSIGRPFQSNFLSVRSREDLPDLFVWALLMSPLANLFVYTHTLKRNIIPRILRRLPVPPVADSDIERVVALADRYLSRARGGKCDMFNSDGFTDKELTNLLLALDAEVLRLYALPARSERLLLEQFRGEQRPGIPVPFTEYYPADTPDVPLYAYRADSYQRSLAGRSAELPKKDIARYESLLAKAEIGKLTNRETDRLHDLQAEVDGRDYAIQCVSKLSVPVITPTLPDEFERRLRALSDRAVSASLKRSQQ